MVRGLSQVKLEDYDDNLGGFFLIDQCLKSPFCSEGLEKIPLSYAPGMPSSTSASPVLSVPLVLLGQNSGLPVPILKQPQEMLH